MKFRKADIPDQHQLEMAIVSTAGSIHDSPAARNGRSFDQIIAAVEQGIIAEQYMIQMQGFSDDTGRYNDVCKCGYSWEVKAWTVNRTFMGRLTALLVKLQGWRQTFTGDRTYKPSKLALFGVKNGQYRLYNCYDIDSGAEITDLEVTDDRFN